MRMTLSVLRLLGSTGAPREEALTFILGKALNMTVFLP